jgi:hypothetical protein
MNKVANRDHDIGFSSLGASALGGANTVAIYGSPFAGSEDNPATPLTNQDHVDNPNFVQQIDPINVQSASSRQ